MSKQLIERVVDETYRHEGFPLDMKELEQFVASSVACIDAERGKEAAKDIPTEEQRDEIIDAARRSFRRSQGGCRGQQISASDDPYNHVIWEAWIMCAKQHALSPTITEGYGPVNLGALKIALNALRRDAENGRPVRGEIADEVERTMIAAAQGERK